MGDGQFQVLLQYGPVIPVLKQQTDCIQCLEVMASLLPCGHMPLWGCEPGTVHSCLRK